MVVLYVFTKVWAVPTVWLDPSPKFQVREVLPVEVSVKVTVNGALPVVPGLTLKLATGAVETGAVEVEEATEIGLELVVVVPPGPVAVRLTV